MSSRFGFALPLILLVSQAPAGKDDEPAIQEGVDALAKAVKAKDDPGAIGVIDQLTQKSKAAGPKDRAKVAKAIGACLDATRTPVEGQGKQETFKLYIAASAALGTMGEEGAKPLLAAIDTKRFKHEIELRCGLVAAAGATKSPAGIKPILDLLKDKDYPVIAAAADALANYREAKEADRKNIVETMVKYLESAKGQADQNPNDTEARKKFDTIGGPLMNSLGKLTGEQIRDPQAWVKWWNDNKKKKW
jgi:HEAT repeat protein